MRHRRLTWLTLSILTLHWHLHPLQAANCCRNSRLVVDEDDFHFRSKPLVVGKLGLFS